MAQQQQALDCEEERIEDGMEGQQVFGVWRRSKIVFAGGLRQLATGGRRPGSFHLKGLGGDFLGRFSTLGDRAAAMLLYTRQMLSIGQQNE